MNELVKHAALIIDKLLITNQSLKYLFPLKNRKCFILLLFSICHIMYVC
jgi:hypothetical protein